MEDNSKYISIINRSTMAKIPVDTVEVVEQVGRKLYIYTMFDEYECYESIDNIARYILDDDIVRPMKTMIINLNKIFEMKDSEVTMQSGRQIWIGKNNYTNLKKEFKAYLISHQPVVIHNKGTKVAEINALRDNMDKFQKTSK